MATSLFLCLMVTWDDNAPLVFLQEYSSRSDRLESICAVAKKNLEFAIVKANDIDVQDCSIYPKRIEMYARRLKQGRPIGTLFCVKKKGRWYLRDGNHRYRMLVKEGITDLRIAFDSENKVY